jgi:acetyl esterase/lipase
VWIGSHAHQLGIDEDRLLVAGGSADGGLAAGTVLMARDRQTPKLCGQLPSRPMLDDRNTTVSAQQSLGLNDGSYDTTQNRTAWGFMLGDRAGGSDVSYYVAPARAMIFLGSRKLILMLGHVSHSGMRLWLTR